MPVIDKPPLNFEEPFEARLKSLLNCIAGDGGNTDTLSEAELIAPFLQQHTANIYGPLSVAHDNRSQQALEPTGEYNQLMKMAFNLGEDKTYASSTLPEGRWVSNHSKTPLK